MTLVQKLSPGIVCSHPRVENQAFSWSHLSANVDSHREEKLPTWHRKGHANDRQGCFMMAGLCQNLQPPNPVLSHQFPMKVAWKNEAHPLSFETFERAKNLWPQLRKPVLLGRVRRNHLPLFPLPPFLGSAELAPNPLVHSTSFLIQCTFMTFLAIAASYMPGVASFFKLCG